jgi:hypothetical protein
MLTLISDIVGLIMPYLWDCLAAKVKRKSGEKKKN